MPRLDTSANMETNNIGGSGFNFTGTRIDHLSATEYTLVTIAVDETGSVTGFAKELRDMLIASVDGCKKSPRKDNILVRVLTFDSHYTRGVNEIHGFKPLMDIDTADYPSIKPYGSTPLNDACFSSMGAINAYAKQLTDQDYNVNAIVFVITDGGENASTATASMVKNEFEKAVREETLESVISILIGVNVGHYDKLLVDYKNAAGFTNYIDGGTATAAQLAKLAGFVSQSVSSQSQALGTGGPSKNISATI